VMSFMKLFPIFNSSFSLLACLFSHYLEGDSARAGAVEFDGEDALPAAELELFVYDIEYLRGRKEERLAMRVSVLTFAIAHIDGANIEIVVIVFYFFGCDAFEHFLHIANEERLGFVYDNRHRCVETLDIHYAVYDAGIFDGGEDIVRDVDELECRLRRKINDVVGDFHRNFVTGVRTKKLVHNYRNRLQTGDGGGDVVFADARDHVFGTFVVGGVLFDDLR